MKKRELIELHSKTIEELKKELLEKQNELSKTKMDMNLGKLKNINMTKMIRKDIARILTLLKEKEEK